MVLEQGNEFLANGARRAQNPNLHFIRHHAITFSLFRDLLPSLETNNARHNVAQENDTTMNRSLSIAVRAVCTFRPRRQVRFSASSRQQCEHREWNQGRTATAFPNW